MPLAGEWEYTWTTCGGLSYRLQADSMWSFVVNKYGMAHAGSTGKACRRATSATQLLHACVRVCVRAGGRLGGRARSACASLCAFDNI